MAIWLKLNKYKVNHEEIFEKSTWLTWYDVQKYSGYQEASLIIICIVIIPIEFLLSHKKIMYLFTNTKALQNKTKSNKINAKYKK